MTIGGNLQLINQICTKSGLQGKDLENLRTNLQNLSKQELEAELVSLLVSGKDDSNKGLQVEQSASAVLLENYQKTYYYDKKGNIITEYKDGDYVIERIIKGKDEEGNEIETTITYRNNRPRTKVVNKNGKREEVYSYTYHDKSDTNFIPSVTVETTKSDKTTVKSEVLQINEYNGDFDFARVMERETTQPNGTITTITKVLNILIEEQKRPDGTILTTYYNGTDIEACDNKQLHKVRQTLKKQNRDIQELYFDGEGNTIVTANAGDGWERLARRFHTTEKKLKELNPKIKNLKAGQDILVPNEFDIESKEIGRVQPRDEAIVQAWNAEVDRQIAQKVTENVSKEDAQELKKAGVKPIAENYIFYERFSKLNPSQKQNVLSMIKYYKAQGITDLNEIKAKILETYPDVNLFDSGKLIKFSNNLSLGGSYFNHYNNKNGQPVSVETFITDYLKLNLKTEPGKTVYERLASIPQESLDNLNASQLGDISKYSFNVIAGMFLNAGLNIMTKAEYQNSRNFTDNSTSAETETQIRQKTVDFAYQMVHKARMALEAHLAEIKDHYIKNFGEIVWEGLKVLPTTLLPSSWTSGSGEYEAVVKNISIKAAELYNLEGDLLTLKGNVNASDFEKQYKKLLKTDYKPDKIQTLMTLAQNQPDKNSPDYSVYEKQMEKAIKDVTGKDFTQNVCSFINWSKGAGSLVETAIFCYVTAGMGEIISVGGQTARAVTVAGKTFTTATRGGAAMVMATNFGRYAAVRAGLNFIDDIDNLLAPMTLEERLRGRKDLTLGGMFVGENNADQIRESLSAIKNWATGKITRDEADKIIKKSFKNLSFDDFVSSNGGQWVLNTVTSSIFGAAAGYASPWFQKAGEIGTKWGQRLGLNTPNIQQITTDLLTKNPAGINAAEFMAKTYEALHATNIAGKGLQFLVETAVFYCTNLPLSLIQETLSESNGELEQAIKEDRLGSYLIGRFGDEALNLLKVKSIGTIIAMMMGTTNIAQLKENFEDYDVLKNTTIRYEDATIQNPDGTFTSGKAVVLEGPTGKLYVDGSSAKFYTAQGQLVVSENIGAQTQFMEMNEGVKTTFLLGKFMQIERYVKSLSNPIEDAVDLSMPYKPSSQEQQLQQTINGLTEIKTQQQTIPAQAVVTPITQQQSTTNPTEQAVEIPINQPVKNPYEKPSMSVVDMSPQQMVAASGVQQTSKAQQSEQDIETVSSAKPLAEQEKIDLHEKMKQIVDDCIQNNYANIPILANLTEQERTEFVRDVLHVGGPNPHDDYDFLFFANGEKPAVLVGGKTDSPELYLDKLKSDNIDVFYRVVTFGNGQKRNNTILINKQMAKSIIQDNKELFQKRLGLNETSTVDEIYEKLISEDSILKDSDDSSDLTGLILGYPKYNTMIFRLDKWILDNNVMTARELRINVDIEKYKSALRQALMAENSPYRSMSEEFKNTLLAKIEEITEVQPSRNIFNNEADGYVFNYTTPEPTELVRIEQSMVRTADKMADDSRVRVDVRKETPQTSADKGIGRVRVNAPQDIGIPEATGVIDQNSANNPYNLTQINTPQEAGEIANKALANSKHRIATAGYSQNSPEGYENTAKEFLQALENELGDNNTAYVTSPTTSSGSIDAITTEVEGLSDNSIFYTTAKNYLSYMSSENTDVDTQNFQQVPKYVLPDTASYSEATAAASNTFIAIGGKNTTVSDFVNAIKYGNKAIILDSTILDAPAWDSENGTVGNASKYISEQIQAVKDGKPLPYPEIEGFTKQFIEENIDKLNSTVKIIQTDGTPSSLKIAAQQTALFLNEENQSLETNDGRVRVNAPQDVEVPQDVNVPAKPTENTMVHDSYVQVIMYPIKRIIEKFGNDFDLDKLEQTLKSLPLETLKNIADKRSGDEVDWDGLTKEKISEIQEALKENGFNDDIHVLMFVYANGDADVKIQRLKDRKDVLSAGTSKEELTLWIKIMNMYDGEYNFYLHNGTRQEEPISQEKPDWQSFKQDRTAVTQVLLNEIKDKNEYENFKTRKGYETDEDAIIPYINQYRKTHPEFKLSDNAKKAMDDFVKKYDTEQFMSNAEIDFEYITNYKQTSYRYNSKHEMAYHSLTNKIFDIRRKFNLDEDENFDLDKLHEKLENLPTETIDDLRRMFEATRISTKEDALRILNMDFANIDIAGIKSMLEDNDCFSYFTLADFAFSTPEEFVIKHQKLLTRKNDLPSNCDYENQRQAWTQIMDMSDEDYNYYRSMQGSYPEGMDIKDLPIYRRLMQEAPEFTNELVGMKKKKYDFFGDEVPRFTLDEIAQLYEVTKTDKEFTMELINRHREKGGLTTGYIYNKSSDIIKIVELTKTFNKEDVKNLALKTIYCDANAIETLLKLKQSDPELYETFITNVYSIDDLEILKDCLEKNQPLTKELMQDTTLSVKNIKAIVDCNKKYFSISTALFEQIDKYHTGNKEDRFNNYKKAEYSQYALECSDEQREVFEELLNAKNSDGTYRYNNEIIDLCELYEKDSKTFEALASLKLTDPNDGRVFYATEDIITEMFECYKEDKETTLQIIKNYPDLPAHNMKRLYDLLKTEDRETVIELISMRNETDTGRRFNVNDIAKLVQLKKENPQEFEEMINAKTLQNGQPVYAYDTGTIEAYFNNSPDYIKHLRSLTTTAKDGNEYKLLNGQQLADINVLYNIITSEPVGDIDMFNEIVYNPKYKFLLQILNPETAPFIGNWNALDILDKYGIENAKGVILTKQESDGQRLLVLNMGNEQKTINLKADKDGNVTVIGEEVSKKREDSNRIRHNFEDGSYLVEEIKYRDFTSGEGKKLKIASNTKKTWYDSDGIQTRSEVMTPVEGKPGEYTINVYERGLNQQMVKQTIGSVKIEENDEGQITRIEKTLTSPDGTVTKQTKTTEEDGFTSTTYEITGVENGENKVLFSQRRSHVKLDENHYTSSLNGQIYDMKFSEEGITVSKLDEEGNPSETITLGSDIVDSRLIPMLKKLPGDVFFLIHKIGITRIYVDESIKKNAQYINKTIRISPDLMNSPFTFMHELYHGVSDNMFNGASKNKDYSDTYDTDLANYQAQASNANEQIIDYFSTRYHGKEGKEETFAEIGAIVSGVEETQEGSDMLGMRSLVLQQNMARTIVQEMNMVEEGMTKTLPEKPPMTSTGITMITSPDGNPLPYLNGSESTSPRGEDTTVSSQNSTDSMVRRSDAPQVAALSKSEFLEKLNLMDKYFDEIVEHKEDDEAYDVADNWDSIKNNAYEIYKQDPETFNILFKGKDFNDNPLPEKVMVYLMCETFVSKNITTPAQLRNIIVYLSLYEHTEDMKYSSALGISEKDFNFLKALEKDRSDEQGDWCFESGAPAGFNEIYKVLTMDLNDVQKQTLTTLLEKQTVIYRDIPTLTRRFATIKNNDDAQAFVKLIQEISPKMGGVSRVATLLADKITTPEMKSLADKLLEVFEADLPASNTRMVNIMQAAHLGAYDRIVELLQNPTKDNKEAIRDFGIAVDKSEDYIKLLEQSGILKDRRFTRASLEQLGKDELKNIINRNLLSPEKNYTAEDIINLSIYGDDTYAQITKYDLMKDFTAKDAQLIVANIDDIEEFDLLKYGNILSADTMIRLCKFSQIREYFTNYPQIQELGPLGINAINEIINANEPGMSSPERKAVHDFGRELCDDVELGKLNKYDCEKLYSNTEVANLEFVRDIYENSDKYGLTIGEIIDIAAITRTEENIPIARRLIDEPSFPNNLIKRLLRCADEDNMDILEKTCFDPEFPKEYIRDILNHASKDKSNAKAINSLLDNPDMKQWFIMNLKNDLDLDLIINLARTQKKLNIEAQQTGRVRRSDAPQAEAKGAEVEEAKPQDVQDAIDKMVKLGMDKNMADKAYVKLCQDKGGNVDKVKLNAVLALVQAFGINKYTNDKGKLRTNPNISPKDIQEIFAFAIGSPLSNANGQFRPDIVKDIIALRKAGITDVKLATTISCIKNMGLVEMKDRFNTKVREDAVKRIEELPEDVKSSIKANGIDLTAIIEKASQEAKGGKVKRTNLETVTLRQLNDIYGDERILITKHKNDKDFDQKIWGDPDKFREWAQKRVDEIMDFDKNPEFTTTFGNAEEINAERKQRIKDWYNYLIKESDYQDDPFVHLLILEEITKELKSDNAATPKPVSPALFNEVHDILINENNNESFDTIYAKKMREKAISLYSHGVQTIDGIEGQWVTIPRTQKGEPNYDEHVAMVQALAEGSSWCLKASNANGYIRSGNIHYFIDKDGKAQVAMHEEPEGITQIQKRYKQDSSVPVPYVGVIEQFYKDNNLHGLENTIKAAKDAKPEFDKLKEKLTKLMEDEDYIAVFKELGFKVTVQDDGTYVLSEFRPLVTSQYSLSELGVDEDKLMANVSGISSAVNLDGSGLTEMKKLQFIKGTLTFGDNQISDLRSLEKVNGQKISWIKPQQTTSPQGNNDRESVNTPQEEGAENGLTRIDTTQDETKKIRTKEQTMEILKRIYNLGIPPYIQKEIDANIEALNQMPLEDFLRVGFPGAYVIGLAKNWKPEFNNLPFDKIPSINQHYASHITQAYVMSLVKNPKQAVFKEENNVVQMGQDGENGTIKFFDFNSLKNSDGTYDINKVYTYLYDTYRSKSTEGMFTPIKTLISAIGLDFTHKFINANKEFFIKFMQTLESGMSNSSQLINILKQLNSQKITGITEIINKGVFDENIGLDELIAKSNIYQALKSSLPEFDSYDKVLQNKIINLIGKYNNPMGLQLGNLFKGILAYSRDLALVEKICDNPSLLSGINKNAQTVVKLFAHHKNIDKDIRNKVYFNLLLMRYFYPENYSTLTHSKGYQQILTGGMSVAVLQNLKYTDKIDEDYFYNLFNNLEKDAVDELVKSDALKNYPENHLKSAVELDPSRQTEIFNWIKNAPDKTLMEKVLRAINIASSNINRNVGNAEKSGNYVNPTEITRERNLLVDLIKMTSENPDIVDFISKSGLSSRETSILCTKILKSNFDEVQKYALLTLLGDYPLSMNFQRVYNIIDFISKAPDKIGLVERILEKGDSDWLSIISENNADYIQDKMNNSEFGSISFQEVLMLILAKDMPEMKDRNNWQHIEDCANALLEDAMTEYMSGYDKIRDEFNKQVTENPNQRRQLNSRFHIAINNLRTAVKEKIKFMSGVLDMAVNSPEKYEQVKNSGFLDMVKQGKLHPVSTIMLNRNSNLSDNIYSDLEAIKTGKPIVPEFPEGTSLDEAFSQTKTGDAVEVGSKMYINDGKQLVEWQMSKEMFLKLFPPVERFATQQGALGDCYLVSSMTSIMNTPESRAELYKSFKLEGNDVVVTIKGYEDFKGSKTFPNGDITVANNMKHVIGCKGMAMLEQTYAQVALREPYFDFLPSLSEDTTPFSLMQRVQSGYSNEAMSELLGLKDLGKQQITASYMAPKKSTVLLNITNPSLYANKVKGYFAQYAGKKNYILQFGTVPKDKEAVESSLLKEYNLVSSHGYNIVGYDSATETVKITNPHNSSVVTEIPFSELVKYMNSLIITNLNE